MFSGRFDHALDEKGRVSIPARFREVLTHQGHDRLFITNFIFERERCLELYPPAQWEGVIEKISHKKTSDRAAQLFEAFYVGNAQEVPVDRQGRILIPPKLREFARLERDGSFLARHNRFQLWAQPALDRIMQLAEQQFEDPEFITKIDL